MDLTSYFPEGGHDVTLYEHKDVANYLKGVKYLPIAEVTGFASIFASKNLIIVVLLFFLFFLGRPLPKTLRLRQSIVSNQIRMLLVS